MQRSDLTGQRFGRLVALDGIPRKVGKKTRMFWNCLCDCGKRIEIVSDNLKSGHTKSCGCLRVDTSRELGHKTSTHGDTRDGRRSPEYLVHTSLVQRATNKRHKAYPKYGAVGRTVCAGLRSFGGFLSVVGRRPDATYSIDRIQNKTGGYWCGKCPECVANEWPLNVRWATPEQQRQNMEDSRLITINGETHCIAEWERIARLPVDRIRVRLKQGWPVDESLLQPPKYNSKKKIA